MDRRLSIKPLQIEVLINATNILVHSCVRRGLDCRDPPLATTRLLYSMGYTQYLIRSLWKTLSKIHGDVTLYKYKGALYNLSIIHGIEPSCMLGENGLFIPLDDLDATRLKHGGHVCLFTPRTHVVRVYLTGSILEHVGIKINIIRLLYLLAKEAGLRKVERLLSELKELAWEGNLGVVEKELISFFKYKKYAKIISFFLPFIPHDGEELLKVSPILRKLHASMKD